ncbi:MAG: hypothetical protein KDD62_01250 [Bdellovibrionales bacterium]|nr:hypothetical protein [Bdellovibrionales bacterium]
MSQIEQTRAIAPSTIDEVTLDTSHSHEVARSDLREYLNKVDQEAVYDYSDILAELENSAPEGASGVSLSINDAAEIAGQRAYEKALKMGEGSGAGSLGVAMAQKDLAKVQVSAAAAALDTEYEMTLEDSDRPDPDNSEGTPLLNPEQHKHGIEQEPEAYSVAEDLEAEAIRIQEAEERKNEELEHQRQLAQLMQGRLQEVRESHVQAPSPDRQTEGAEFESRLEGKQQQEEFLLRQLLRTQSPHSQALDSVHQSLDQVTERDGRVVSERVLTIYFELQDFSKQQYEAESESTNTLN